MLPELPSNYGQKLFLRQHTYATISPANLSTGRPRTEPGQVRNPPSGTSISGDAKSIVTSIRRQDARSSTRNQWWDSSLDMNLVKFTGSTILGASSLRFHGM